MRRAKIVCTIGPASRNEKTLKKLIDAGMDVARMNFSHGSHMDHGKAVEMIRRLSDRVAIMQDLQGPKIRIGEVRGGEKHLGEGEVVILSAEEGSGEAGLIHVTYPDLPKDVSAGDSIYIADGVIRLEVEKVAGKNVHCRTLHGGLLTSGKGVNLPGVRISAPALTAKDRADLEFGLELGVDYVALSFVRNAGEVMEVKELLSSRGSPALVVAKIEKREALEELEGILDVADALMIARGDLGVEVPAEEVPVIQKTVISECLMRGKPVITATQMLESMVKSQRPTRAEASDVANAVIDGTDALMLSAETAMGRYPVEAVEVMDRIIKRAESFKGEAHYPHIDEPGRLKVGGYGTPGPPEADMLTDAVCSGAVDVAAEIGASAIACLTNAGKTARLMSRYRPGVPVLALTDNIPVIKQMALVWGVISIAVESIESTEKIFAIVKDKIAGAGYTGKVVYTAGIPTKERKPTNTIHVVHI